VKTKRFYKISRR